MAAASGTSSGKDCAINEQGQPSYWIRTSPSSLSHIIHSRHHAIVALFGVFSFASFSYGLITQKPFDAVLSSALVILCLYIYTLQSDRRRRKSEQREGLLGVSIAPGDPKPKDGTRAGAGRAADGTSELDLTGYAKTLGMSIRNGVVHKEGGTLNKILMDALAKEYLRCVTALRCYQDRFGPLDDDTPEENDSVASQSRTVETEPPRPDPLVTTLTQLPSLNLEHNLAALAEPAAPTPRSPGGLCGPPSPDPKRCRVQASKETPVTSAADGTPAPAAPANTPATALIDDAKAAASDTNGTDPASPEHRMQFEEAVESPVWRMEDVKATEPWAASPARESEKRKSGAQPVTFGLFGSGHRSTDSL